MAKTAAPVRDMPTTQMARDLAVQNTDRMITDLKTLHLETARRIYYAQCLLVGVTIPWEIATPETRVQHLEAAHFYLSRAFALVGGRVK